MQGIKIVATNKKAFHDYFVEETYEAGVSLRGTEVKSIREGRVNLRDSFARIEDGEAWLYNCHISPYSHGRLEEQDPLRKRKLLFHREEINRLMGKVQQRGYTLVPVKVYFKEGKAKIELALAKGKKLYDKREALKKKDLKREAERILKDRKM